MFPLSFYEDLFNNIQSFFYEKYSINNLNKNKVVSVDGTYNNTNLINNDSLETSLNMGYCDFTNGIHVNIKFKGFEKKNISTNNVIFVIDRVYDSYDLFNYMDRNNYEYVCRVKKSCLYLDKDKNKDKINKKKNKLENEKVRFILYQHKYLLTVKTKKINNQLLKKCVNVV
jgi:hypothetical protein